MLSNNGATDTRTISSTSESTDGADEESGVTDSTDTATDTEVTAPAGEKVFIRICLTEKYEKLEFGKQELGLESGLQLVLSEV
jgi:hypothetical protein